MSKEQQINENPTIKVLRSTIRPSDNQNIASISVSDLVHVDIGYVLESVIHRDRFIVDGILSGRRDANIDEPIESLAFKLTPVEHFREVETGEVFAVIDKR